jgi:hypothetical protein
VARCARDDPSLAPREGAELPPEVAPVGDALDVLAQLHRGRNRRPIADTVGRLLEAVRAHAALAIWPTGEQALANCLRVMDLARRFERQGAASFRAFVDRLEEDAESGDTEDAPVVEEGTEGVRIMTAHRAKGLEFPVVVLCDPTANAARDQPSRHVDPERSLWAEPLAGCAPRELLDAGPVELARDRAEATRLAYVAATRARDLLVVTAVADVELSDKWLSALNAAIYPTQRSPGEGEPAPGCPAFRGAAVAERPGNARPGNRAPVNAGRLAPREGRHSVVWWDPKALKLDAKERVGLRQQRILEADERGAAAEGERVHAQWQSEREALLAAGARASVAVAPVTALAEEQAATGPASDVRIETVVARAQRPSGRRFGCARARRAGRGGSARRRCGGGAHGAAPGPDRRSERGGGRGRDRGRRRGARASRDRARGRESGAAARGAGRARAAGRPSRRGSRRSRVPRGRRLDRRRLEDRCRARRASEHVCDAGAALRRRDCRGDGRACLRDAARGMNPPCRLPIA